MCTWHWYDAFVLSFYFFFLIFYSYFLLCVIAMGTCATMGRVSPHFMFAYIYIYISVAYIPVFSGCYCCCCSFTIIHPFIHSFYYYFSGEAALLTFRMPSDRWLLAVLLLLLSCIWICIFNNNQTNELQWGLCDGSLIIITNITTWLLPLCCVWMCSVNVCRKWKCLAKYGICTYNN